MAKRVYKLQEFVGHPAGVNCLNIGKKTCRLLLTGGEDHKVNLWAVGKPTSLMSLCGHTSPVESVAFDSTEVLVLAGASTGAIKMWDLEETKMVRTLNGHRSYCTAVEFHPFGEFFASGSMDTNLRIWDIRKKGCVHTYRGHTGGINTIKFTPDGRWLVSGGLDNVVKAWDFTAGRLLHDFKSHEGHIRSIDFHPLEFLLATGSADRTIKFWDLDSFELVGSSRAEGAGVRCVKFHPDGSILFCGRDDGLKVYSWEPVLCHDTFDMDWSTLGDICINDGKLLACSYHRSSVGVWVADISLVEPSMDHFNTEKSDLVTFNIKEIQIPENEEDTLKSERFCYSSPEHETKEIRTIYVDSAGGKPALPRARSLNSSKVENLDSKDIDCLQNQEVTEIVSHGTCDPQGNSASFALPSVISEGNVERKHLSNYRRESPLSVSFGRNMPITSNHACKLSSGTIDFDKVSLSEEKKLSCDSSDVYYTAGSNFIGKHLKVGTAKDSADVDQTNVGSINDKYRSLSPETPSPWTSHGIFGLEQQKSSIKHVNGVFPGRTRSLVEKFERKERRGIDENDAIHRHLPTICERITTSSDLIGQPQISGRELTSSDANCSDILMQDHESFLTILYARLAKLQVVRNFWEQNDIKAAIGTLLNLSDYSVQVDVITVISEKSEILNLDLFSCLLPVLSSLLQSRTERHIKASTETLLKFVGVFAPVIHTTIQARPVVGVDLHADRRREWCDKCFAELQKIQKFLPKIMMRGGTLGRCAQELNLILKES